MLNEPLGRGHDPLQLLIRPLKLAIQQLAIQQLAIQQLAIQQLAIQQLAIAPGN